MRLREQRKIKITCRQKDEQNMQKKFQDRVRSCDVCLVNDGWNHEYGIKIRVRDNLRK